LKNNLRFIAPNVRLTGEKDRGRKENTTRKSEHHNTTDNTRRDCVEKAKPAPYMRGKKGQSRRGGEEKKSPLP